ncbi:MAG: glycosyltransferase [Cyanobacteria bacterium]|nr:glycosyltransferase [Cyanobacteriota bacterium]
MIPKIIHQTWKSSAIPQRLRRYQESWLQYHPEWEYRFWDDEANESLIAEHYPEFVDHYRRLTPAILKVDLVRLAYLHRHGGVYADLDYEVIRPLDDLFDISRVIVGRERGGIGWPIRGRDYVINALMASPPGHPLWLEIMHGMVEAYRPRRAFERHTRYVIRMAIAILDDHVEGCLRDDGDVIVLPYEILYPSMPTQRITEHRRRIAKALGAYGIHHYDNSWRTPLARLANRGRVIVQHCLS